MTTLSASSIAFCIILAASCAKPELKRQERARSEAALQEKPVQAAPMVDWRTRLRVPRVGDTWKYKGFGDVKYRTFSVDRMVEVSTLVPSDNSDIYGCPAFKVTNTYRDGRVTVEPELKVILFCRDSWSDSKVRVSEVSGHQEHPRTLFVLPLSLGLNSINESYDPALDRMTETNFVTEYFDSVKVTAGTFHKVWKLHRSMRVNMSVETVWDEYLLYAEEVGVIKLSSLVRGEIKPVLELVSYKMRK